jgi:hypothetical protein
VYPFSRRPELLELGDDPDDALRLIFGCDRKALD